MVLSNVFKTPPHEMVKGRFTLEDYLRHKLR